MNDGLGGSATDFVIITISTGGGLPPPAPYLYPINPSISENGTVTIHWDPSVGATIYFIYRNNQLITTVSGLTAIAYSYTTYYTDTNLPEGTYYYVVVAHNQYGDSPMSNCVSVMVDRPDPEPEPEPPSNDENSNDGDNGNPFGGVPGYPIFELFTISVAVIAVIIKLRKR